MPLFDAKALTKRYTARTKAQSTKYQDDAENALKSLKDDPTRRGQYHKYFKLGWTYAIDLSDLVERALSADHPGKYFLAAARKRLGVTKPKP